MRPLCFRVSTRRGPRNVSAPSRWCMRNRIVILIACLLALSSGAQDYKQALPGYHYDFPRDYFNHPDYQTEWWYYTGNLHTREGRTFGFELTFFRSGVSREPAKDSAWDLRDLYVAHFVISDLDYKKFFHTEYKNRSDH